MESSGLDRVLSRMAELAARFAPALPARVDAGEPPEPLASGKVDFSAALTSAAAASGVDPRLLAAVVRAESGGDPHARSAKGAMGLMQLMPETAGDYGVTDPFDPLQSMVGGGKHLRRMIDRFGNLPLGLAAYNAGEGAVSRHQGIPPYRETQAFVRRVLDLYGDNQP